MHITYKGDYALKAILDLALHAGETVTMHELAMRADIPLKFLEQVLLDLKRGGFVESKRGKIGGYHLAKAPAQIKLLDVLKFIDGPIEPIACVEKEYSGCRDVYRCVFRKVWQDVTGAISQVIGNISFEDLVSQLKIKNKDLVYSI